MKRCTRFAPLVALVTVLFVPTASAVTIDFIKLTENSAAQGGLGESAWSTLTIPTAFAPNTFGMKITGHALTATNMSPDDNDPIQYAYLDWNNAGLGVCKDLLSSASTGANPGSGTNRCAPGSDDNVTDHEYLEFIFDEDVVVDNLWFNNNHDNGFGSGDQVRIGVGDRTTDLDAGNPPPFLGTAYDVALGYADGPNGIGSFSVNTNQKLWIAFENEQFYLSAIEVSAVPVPAAFWLFGTALIGFVGLGRRTSVG